MFELASLIKDSSTKKALAFVGVAVLVMTGLNLYHQIKLNKIRIKKEEAGMDTVS